MRIGNSGTVAPVAESPHKIYQQTPEFLHHVWGHNLQEALKPVVRASGLELITALLLSCLDSPTRVLCPCRVFVNGPRPVPMAPVPRKNPDARADYEGFTILVEATIGRNTGRQSIQRQYNSAVDHVVEALAGSGIRRGYCFVVSRAQLRLPHGPSLIEDAQKKLEEKHGIGNVKFLAWLSGQ